jgi:hypothetical protein
LPSVAIQSPYLLVNFITWIRGKAKYPNEYPSPIHSEPRMMGIAALKYRIGQSGHRPIQMDTDRFFEKKSRNAFIQFR